MPALTKVEWLRKIAAKLAGEDVCTANDDTICETLEKILMYLPDGGVNPPTVDVSDQFKIVVGSNKDVTINEHNIKALKCGHVYKLYGNVNVTLSVAIGVKGVWFAIDGLSNVQDSMCTGLVIMPSGYAIMSALLVAENNDIEMYANSSFAAGTYDVKFDFTFIASTTAIVGEAVVGDAEIIA